MNSQEKTAASRVWLEIDLEAVRRNFAAIAGFVAPCRVMAVLKANAYGLGMRPMAETLKECGAYGFGVAELREALELKPLGLPTHILGGLLEEEIPEVIRSGIVAAVTDLATARRLSEEALRQGTRAECHFLVDTGMGRLGISPQDAVAFVRSLAALPGVIVEGIFTHLSVADGGSEWEQAYTAGQLKRFSDTLDALRSEGIDIPLVHGVNSAGLLDATVGSLAAAAPLAGHTLVRAGIAVYGLHPSAEVQLPEDFRPALAWKTQVAQVKTLPPGSFVSYGATYCTPDARRIAVIPVGYADGFRRAPQNWGEVLVRGSRAPIVGRVTMDQTMIDVTHIAGVRQGDEVVLIGAQGTDRITAEEVAARLGTINYEVVSAILARVPRETPA